MLKRISWKKFIKPPVFVAASLAIFLAGIGYERVRNERQILFENRVSEQTNFGQKIIPIPVYTDLGNWQEAYESDIDKFSPYLLEPNSQPPKLKWEIERVSSKRYESKKCGEESDGFVGLSFLDGKIYGGYETSGLIKIRLGINGKYDKKKDENGEKSLELYIKGPFVDIRFKGKYSGL